MANPPPPPIPPKSMINRNQPKSPDQIKKDAEEKKKLDKKKALEPQVPVVVSSQIDEVMRRVRMLEERYTGLRKKTQFTEQSMLKDAKDLFEDMHVLNDTVSELKNEISDINQKMNKLSDEISNSIDKSEFQVLAKYIDFWQPMDFLTRKQAKEMIEDFKNNK